MTNEQFCRIHCGVQITEGDFLDAGCSVEEMLQLGDKYFPSGATYLGMLEKIAQDYRIKWLIAQLKITLSHEYKQGVEDTRRRWAMSLS